MTILVTGSTGKTASAVASQLPESHPPLVASRKGPTANSEHPTVRFDWHDPSTYALPFEHELAKQSPITGVYIVSPPFGEPDPAYTVIDFIKFAKDRGVKRFVLLSQLNMDETTPYWYGIIHKYLKEESGVEWAVLRPTFFMELLSDVFHTKYIKQQDKFYTAAADGKVSFISTHDIAAVAVRCLVDEQSHNTDYGLRGRQSINYDEIAAILSDVLGRKIEHAQVSDEQIYKLALEFEADATAKEHAELDLLISKHLPMVTEPDDSIKQITGREARTFKEFAELAKKTWE